MRISTAQDCFRKPKYKNTKCTYVVNGEVLTFDSALERNRYQELLLLQKANQISDLQRQVKYKLIDNYEIAGKKVRGVSYVADFVYKDKNGNTVVEDTKGFRTKEYIIKKKLFESIYKIPLTEVYLK